MGARAGAIVQPVRGAQKRQHAGLFAQSRRVLKHLGQCHTVQTQLDEQPADWLLFDRAEHIVRIGTSRPLCANSQVPTAASTRNFPHFQPIAYTGRPFGGAI
jgi:uncharacterized protein HemX